LRTGDRPHVNCEMPLDAATPSHQSSPNAFRKFAGLRSGRKRAAEANLASAATYATVGNRERRANLAAAIVEGDPPHAVMQKIRNAATHAGSDAQSVQSNEQFRRTSPGGCLNTTTRPFATPASEHAGFWLGPASRQFKQQLESSGTPGSGGASRLRDASESDRVPRWRPGAQLKVTFAVDLPPNLRTGRWRERGVAGFGLLADEHDGFNTRRFRFRPSEPFV
jgi:hypothetical protein